MTTGKFYPILDTTHTQFYTQYIYTVKYVALGLIFWAELCPPEILMLKS